MAKFNNITQTWQKNRDYIQQKLDNLSARDRFALLILTIFLFGFVVIFGGWEIHQKANRSQQSYDHAIAELFWLRSQANNINANQTSNHNPTDMIQQIFSNANISAQILENSGKIQLQFHHAEGSVIGNILGQIHQQGFVISQLQMNQTNMDQIEVRAIVSQNP